MKSSQQLALFLLLIFTGIHCQVKFVFELLRNGVSSPIKLGANNTDIFGERWLRPEQITVTGMKNMFVLGQKLRKHYVNKHLTSINLSPITGYKHSWGFGIGKPRYWSNYSIFRA
jgi:hypothetical protein